MRNIFLSLTLTAAAVAAAVPTHAAQADSEHPSAKRAFSLPPSADLSYTIKARQKGMAIGGDALVQWRQGDGKYSIATESHAGIFGKILESRSEGAVDGYGLAPASFYEKRFRKEPTTATFKRDAKTITFSKGDESYPIKGGEQDRTSAPWQLAAIARSAPEKFTPGSEWAFFVAGRRDAEPWVFKVLKHEPVQTGVGEVEAIHFSKSPPKSDQGQQVDLWLAPSLDWYPVRIRFDDDGDTVDQLLDKITRK
ncbi:DUF3108 domain-containing protein [Pseudoduganella sp. LjRoot289]|uniref:DUF3108 domain-containing protein n=1 Tax=Pseudoduganella sp. LjRoot289 TaxID=3342314 RepID=UPI003ECDDAC6